MGGGDVQDRDPLLDSPLSDASDKCARCYLIICKRTRENPGSSDSGSQFNLTQLQIFFF